MDISILDFILFNGLSYMLGIATGLGICCKHKDKFMTRSRSLETITNAQYNHHQHNMNRDDIIVASAPLPTAPMAPMAHESSPQKKTLHLTLE